MLSNNVLQYWLTFDDPSDVITLLPPAVLRTALAERPQNILTLLRTVIGHLLALLQDADFPKPRTSSRPSRTSIDVRPMLNRMTLNGISTEQPDLAREALNCIRVLTRVLPYVFERCAPSPLFSTSRESTSSSRDFSDGSSGRSMVDEVFWTKRRVKTEHREQFVIDDEEEAENGSANGGEWIEIPSLGEQLSVPDPDLKYSRRAKVYLSESMLLSIFFSSPGLRYLTRLPRRVPTGAVSIISSGRPLVLTILSFQIHIIPRTGMLESVQTFL